ncbi:hypothetical protein AVEN_190259-1, partial [Araneus ventricosus]
FGDDLKDWLPFWSQFYHIDKDYDIAPENKFQYLVQAIVVCSRAREVVETFPPTGENYAKAVDSLKARFGRGDRLVEVYVRELLKIIIFVQSNQRLSPTFLYDKLESYLRALETLGVTTDKCASILYSMVESCFDEEFLKAWNRSPASSSANDAKERLENLMLFLKDEVEAEERISLAMSGFGLTKGEVLKMPRKKKYSCCICEHQRQRLRVEGNSPSVAVPHRVSEGGRLVPHSRRPQNPIRTHHSTKSLLDYTILSFRTKELTMFIRARNLEEANGCQFGKIHCLHINKLVIYELISRTE